MSTGSLVLMLVVCAGYVGYAAFAVLRLRPHIARALSSRLGTPVRAGTQGLWHAPEAGAGVRLVVGVLDLVVLLLLTLGPLVVLLVGVWTATS